jgi:RimJ/RimL family protein N-acetyltransferase
MRAAWGRGLATEGAAAVVRHGFESVGAEKISARTLAGNLASQRVMRKCGLAFERGFVYPDDGIPGRPESERAAVKYSITRADWLARQA